MSKATKTINIVPFETETVEIEIEGTADLILCKMTEEAARKIKEKQSKKAKEMDEPLNMYQQLIESIHWMDGKETDYTEEGWQNAMQNNRVGYDVSGIKKGLLEAAVRVLGEKKSTIINANLQVIPEKANLVPIEFGGVSIEEAILTNWKNSAFLVYRNIFNNWRCKLRISYLPSNISVEQVIQLVSAMGFSGGLGAHRVGLKGGTNGTFKVVGAQMVESAA